MIAERRRKLAELEQKRIVAKQEAEAYRAALREIERFVPGNHALTSLTLSASDNPPTVKGSIADIRLTLTAAVASAAAAWTVGSACPERMSRMVTKAGQDAR